MNIEIRKCFLRLETSPDNPFLWIKAACYKNIDDVRANIKYKGTVHGNMDVWYKTDALFENEEIETYDKLAPIDEWVELEEPATTIDVMFILDGFDPMLMNEMLPTVVGKKRFDPESTDERA